MLDASPLADQVGYLVAHAHRQLRDDATEQLAELGLHPRDFGLLNQLARDTPCSQAHLADRLQVTRPPILALLDVLEARQLVERARSEQDRRVHEVTLTDEGRRRWAAPSARPGGSSARSSSSSGPRRDVDLRELLAKLIAADRRQTVSAVGVPVGRPARSSSAVPSPSACGRDVPVGVPVGVSVGVPVGPAGRRCGRVAAVGWGSASARGSLVPGGDQLRHRRAAGAAGDRPADGQLEDLDRHDGQDERHDGERGRGLPAHPARAPRVGHVEQLGLRRAGRPGLGVRRVDRPLDDRYVAGAGPSRGRDTTVSTRVSASFCPAWRKVWE